MKYLSFYCFVKIYFFDCGVFTETQILQKYYHQAQETNQVFKLMNLYFSVANSKKTLLSFDTRLTE